MRALEITYEIYSIIINSIAVFSSRISPKVRAGLMELSMFGLSLLGIIAYSNSRIKELLRYDNWVLTISTLLLIIVLFTSIDKKITRIRRAGIRPLFWSCWYLCYVLIVLSSLRYYVRAAYLVMGILSLTVFPMIMIIWYNRRDYFRFCILIARNMVLATYYYLAMNILLVGFISNTEDPELGYLGITANPNSNGLIILPFFTAALFLLIVDKKYNFYYLFSLAICVMVAYISKRELLK